MNSSVSSGATLTESDLKNLDTMSHALKSLATYTAMKDSTERRRRYYEPDYRRY